MLDFDYELESDKAEVVEVYAMTSLGRLVFVDNHSRHVNSQTSCLSAIDVTESLSLAFENLVHMPFDIIDSYSGTLCTLDISHNRFSRNLQFLSEFENLTSLNLDHNNIDTYTVFPFMPKLHLLWLNYNNVEDLFPFLRNLYKSIPNLRYLCLMGNKAAPSYLNGGTFYEYLQYRLFVISWFPHLMHLDDRVVTEEQRLEAKRLFKRPLFEQLAENTPLSECIKLMHNKMSNIFTNSIYSLPESFKAPKDLNVII